MIEWIQSQQYELSIKLPSLCPFQKNNWGTVTGLSDIFSLIQLFAEGNNKAEPMQIKLIMLAIGNKLYFIFC